MVCKNQNCKADFCWVCLGPWDPHGSSWYGNTYNISILIHTIRQKLSLKKIRYNCNRFDELEARLVKYLLINLFQDLIKLFLH